MPHTTRSRHRRRRGGVPPPGVPLTGPEEALRVILAAASDPPVPETVVLLLDHAHRGVTCMVCDGASTASQVTDVGTLLVEVAAQEPSFGAAVLATVRPGGGITPSADDDETGFFGLRHELAAVGVELLDWFLLADGLVASVAELVDACWRWTAEEPRS